MKKQSVSGREVELYCYPDAISILLADNKIAPQQNIIRMNANNANIFSFPMMSLRQQSEKI